MTVATIEHAVCSYFNIPLLDLHRRRQLRTIVRARWHVWYLLRHRHDWTLADIASHYGKDGSTVLYGMQMMDQMVNSSTATRLACAEIGRSLDPVKEGD